MNTPSDDLHKLIKSLTPSERGYFKKFASLSYGKESNYMRLFNAIEQQDEYEEKKIKQIFKNETLIKHLPSEKNHLYKIILEHLYAYGSDQSVDVKLNKMLFQIQILFKKNLFYQCQKLLLRAKKMAIEAEKYPQIIALIRLQMIFSNKIPIENVQVLIHEQNAGVKIYANELAYSQLLAELLQLKIKNNLPFSKEMKELMNRPLLTDEKKALSFSARMRFLNLRANYSLQIGDLPGSYRFGKRLVELIESTPRKMKRDEKFYNIALMNLLIILDKARYYEELVETTVKLRSVVTTDEESAIEVFTVSYVTELNMYIYTGEFEKGLALIPQFISSFEMNSKKMNPYNKLIITCKIAILFFGANQLKKALLWINKTLNQENEGSPNQAIRATSILNLIVHFELGNMDLLEHLIKSTNYLQVEKQSLYKVEVCVLNFFKGLPESHTPKELMNEFKKLKTKFVFLLKDPLEKEALNYFDYPSWVESKIKQRPFAEIVREKYRKAPRILL